MKISKDRLQWMVSKSLVNCHCPGVDSIMFDDRKESYRRAFIATPYHHLWKNMPPLSFSLGLHPHHCDITLQKIFGNPFNVRVAELQTLPGEFRKGPRLEAYEFRSPIRGETGRFVPLYQIKKFDFYFEPFEEIHLKAHELHTIYLPRGEEAAWYVFEGQEDSNYRPICWSNDDLQDLDFSMLYQPMTMNQLLMHLGRMSIEIV